MCGQLTPLTRDFHRLLKNVKKLTDNQVKVLDYGDDISEFSLEIKPNDGFYKRGKFEFKIELKNYPQNAPKVECLTDIYHPNINSEYERDICLSLFDDWTSQNDLEDCVQGLLFLLYNPNLEDPLNAYFDPTDDEQIERFADDVKLSLEGGDVEGFYYERNIVEDGTTNSNENVENSNNAENHREVELVVATTAQQTTAATTTGTLPATTAATATTPSATTPTAPETTETTPPTTTLITTTTPPTTTPTTPKTPLATTTATPSTTAGTTIIIATTAAATPTTTLTTTTRTTTTASATSVTTIETTDNLNTNPEKDVNEKGINCNNENNINNGSTVNNLNEKLENSNKEVEKKTHEKSVAQTEIDIAVSFQLRGTFPQYYYWNA